MTLTPDELRQMRERCEKWLETPGSVRTSAQIMLRLLDALEEKERENAALRTALRSIQWGDLKMIGNKRYDYCPWCQISSEGGHSSDCIVGAALKETR